MNNMTNVRYVIFLGDSRHEHNICNCSQEAAIARAKELAVSRKAHARLLQRGLAGYHVLIPVARVRYQPNKKRAVVID